MEQKNKYIFDIDTLQNIEDEERKNDRKRKHRNSRIISWIVLLVLLCIIIVAGVFGAKYLIKRFMSDDNLSSESSVTTSTASSEEQDDIREVIESIIGDETEVVIAPVEEIVPELTEEELFNEAVVNFVASMSIEDKVAGMFLVTPEELTGVQTVTRAGDGTKTALEKYAVGGIIYSAKNMTSKDQFAEVIKNTVSYARYPLFLAADEQLGNTSFSNTMKVTATMTAAEIGVEADPSIAYLEEEKIVRYMAEYGLNLNTGVVADIMVNDDSVMKGKSFGTEAEKISPLLTKAIAALNEYGILSAVKFFPGQGSVSVDTGNGLAVSARTREEMDANEFLCFKAAVEGGADIVIISHISAPELTGDNTQCSQSKYVMTDLIRKEWEYDDVIIMTDSMSKAAISSYYDSKDASITAIKSGADMVMCPEDFPAAYEGVMEAVNSGVIAKERVEDSLIRIYKRKFKNMTSEEINALIPAVSEDVSAGE